MAWVWLVVSALAAGSGCSADASVPQTREGALADFAIVRIGEDPGVPCPRPTAVPTEPGDTIILDRVSGFPCMAVTVETGIDLLPSADGSRPDPNWPSVSRDSGGRIYTSAARLSTAVLAWHPDGAFDEVIGRPGEGPGEFGRVGDISVGPGDSLYIRHGARLSVFDADRRFVREMLAPGVTPTRGMSHYLPTGLVVSTARITGVDDDEPFHVSDLSGTILRSFGASLEGARRLDDGSPIFSRPSVVSGPNTFWAAPEPGARDGYVLEEWTTGGELARVLLRPVPWFEPGAGSDDPLASQLPTFFLHSDASGLLWVVIGVKDPRYRPIDPASGVNEDEIISELLDLRVEVIDPDAGEVLVSALLDVVPAEEGMTTLRPSRCT